MTSISETFAAAKDRLLGSATQSTPSGKEPDSGTKGAGTPDDPYDAGNREAAVGQGIEPPSGQTGPGTLDKPYDQGNQPDNPPETPSTTAKPAEDEPKPAPARSTPSRSQGADILASISKSKSTENSAGPESTPSQSQEKESASNTSNTKSPESPTSTESSAPKSQGADILASISRTKSKPAEEPTSTESRGRDETSQPATSTATAAATTTTATSADKAEEKGAEKSKWPVRDPKERERSISPGTLDDGTHAQTSGDKGESYAPGKMDRFKGKLGLGRH